jgi:hypothetical protein
VVPPIIPHIPIDYCLTGNFAVGKCYLATYKVTNQKVTAIAHGAYPTVTHLAVDPAFNVNHAHLEKTCQGLYHLVTVPSTTLIPFLLGHCTWSVGAVQPPQWNPTDPANPTCDEWNNYLGAGMVFHHQHVGQMAILNPAYIATPILTTPFTDNDNMTPMEILTNAFNLAMHLHNIQMNQANTMAAFQAAMHQPLPPPPAPPVNVPLPQQDARPNSLLPSLVKTAAPLDTSLWR